MLYSGVQLTIAELLYDERPQVVSEVDESLPHSLGNHDQRLSTASEGLIGHGEPAAVLGPVSFPVSLHITLVVNRTV